MWFLDECFILIMKLKIKPWLPLKGLSPGNVGAYRQLIETFSKPHLNVVDGYQVENDLDLKKYTLPRPNSPLGILFRRRKE